MNKFATMLSFVLDYSAFFFVGLLSPGLMLALVWFFIAFFSCNGMYVHGLWNNENVDYLECMINDPFDVGIMLGLVAMMVSSVGVILGCIGVSKYFKMYRSSQ